MFFEELLKSSGTIFKPKMDYNGCRPTKRIYNVKIFKGINKSAPWNKGGVMRHHRINVCHPTMTKIVAQSLETLPHLEYFCLRLEISSSQLEVMVTSMDWHVHVRGFPCLTQIKKSSKCITFSYVLKKLYTLGYTVKISFKIYLSQLDRLQYVVMKISVTTGSLRYKHFMIQKVHKHLV